MANELATPMGVDDCDGPALNTLGDVRRQLGRVVRLMMKYKLDPKVGGVVTIALGTLAKSMEAADLAQFSDEEIIAEMRRRRDLRVDADAEH